MKKFSQNLICVFIGLCSFVVQIHAQGNGACGSDNANDAIYASWDNGDNGGNGFEPWVFNINGTSGFFISSSNNNAGGSQGIDVSGESFGLYSSNGWADARRSFTEPLTVGSTFSFSMDNGWVDNTGDIGFEIENNTGSNLMYFTFSGGQANYEMFDSAGEFDTGIGFTGDGLNFVFTIKSGNMFDLLITDASGTTTSFLNRSFAAVAGSSEVSRIRMANFGAGAGSNNDLYFNSFEVCYPMDVTCGELFFSEYIEGSSNTKCIEIYNPTNTVIDLAAENYTIFQSFNGGNSTGTIPLTGTIEANDVYVVCDDGAAAAFLAIADQQYLGSMFNGDDALLLRKDGVLIDAFGQEGTDPGSQWNVAGVETQNQTLVRMPHVLIGDLDQTNAFDPSAEWIELDINTVSELGHHQIGFSEANVTGQGMNIADGTTAIATANDTDFGNILKGASDTHTFTIQNTGLTDMLVCDVSSDDAAFAVINTLELIAPGASGTFTVEFSPTAVGAQTATITIQTSDIDEAEYTFTLGGTGISPEIDVLGNSMSIASGTTATATTNDTDFGNQSVCSGSVSKTFTIDNTAGTATLNVTSIMSSDAQFVISGAPTTVATGATETFTVTFDPTTAGAQSSTITIISDDCDEATYTFAVDATGVDPEIDVLGNSMSIASGTTATATTNDTDFESIDITTTSTNTFTINNSGNDALVISSISSSDGQFVIPTTTPINISASGSATFDIEFTPTSVGVHTSTITINNNDCDEATYTFAVTGEGLLGCTFPDVPTITASSNTICTGETVTLSISSGNLNDATAWTWYSASCGGTAVGTGISIMVSPTTATDYFARGEGGCVTPGACAMTSIAVNALPTMTLATTDETCPSAMDGTIEITGTGVGTLEYSLNGAAYVSFTANPEMLTGLGANTYSLQVKDANGCESASQMVTINAGTDAMPPMAVCADITIALVNGAYSLTAADLMALAGTSSDNCSALANMTITSSIIDLNCTSTNPSITTLTITDEAGNITTCTPSINIDPASIPTGSTVYVDANATGANTGLSWTDAYTSLQDALTLSNNCTVITDVWVAAGTYVPGAAGDRGATFEMKDGLNVYGGFQNGDTALTDADPAANITILSGDIDMNDTESPITDVNNKVGDNSHTVVTVPSSVTSNTILKGFTITAGDADGNILAPLAQRAGAGMLNNGNANFENLIFSGNCASVGGGVYNNALNSMISSMFNNCEFRHNATTYGGAGMYNDGRGSGVLEVELNNPLFTDNTAGTSGGGVTNDGSSGGTCSPTFNQATFSANNATDSGAGMQNLFATPNISNSIFSDNDGVTPISDNNSTVNIQNSMVEGNYQQQSEFLPYYVFGPSFNNNVALWNFNLSSISPAIDIGNNGLLPSYVVKDLAGNARIDNGIVDLGAYEFQSAALPIELLDFNVIKSGKKAARLSWSTASESSNKGWHIQRSTDGLSWETLVFVDGAINSTERLTYELEDDAVNMGWNYYQLKQEDLDGSFSYSPVRNLYFENKEVVLFPNPAMNQVYIVLPSDRDNLDANVEIYDELGRLIQTIQTNEISTNISIEDLPVGTYAIRIQLGNELIHKTLIKL